MKKTILDLSAIRFLIVDDNAHMRWIISQILRSLGAESLREAEDGAEALAILGEWDVDIVIVDWMMTPLDGIDFTKLVRTAADSRNPMVPIIMLTGYSEADRIGMARNAGVTEVVVKPVSARALYLRIEEVILRPRQFVRCKTFVGPDRHRRSDENYHGPRRRRTDNEGDEDVRGASMADSAATAATELE